MAKRITTYRYRVKDATCKHLCRLAKAVNFVWNYCNEVTFDALRNRGKWLTWVDLNKLTAGSSKLLGLHADTINAVGEELASRRKAAKRRRLKWRGQKSLGWIPFKARSIQVNGSTVVYRKKCLRFWKSREIVGTIKTGSFNQDARGRWYVNLQCEVEEELTTGSDETGIDLGLKTVATLSDGTKYGRENLTRAYADKLAMAQRARKPRLVKTIHAKITNARKDFAHKTSTEIVKRSKLIVVGNIKPRDLAKTRMAKSVLDAGWSQLRSMLRYKAIRHGASYQEISERWSTVTCSACCSRSGPSGLSGLAVREWLCSICGVSHDRDVNAARNILASSPLRTLRAG